MLLAFRIWMLNECKTNEYHNASPCPNFCGTANRGQIQLLEIKFQCSRFSNFLKNLSGFFKYQWCSSRGICVCCIIIWQINQPSGPFCILYHSAPIKQCTKIQKSRSSLEWGFQLNYRSNKKTKWKKRKILLNPWQNSRGLFNVDFRYLGKICSTSPYW